MHHEIVGHTCSEFKRMATANIHGHMSKLCIFESQIWARLEEMSVHRNASLHSSFTTDVVLLPCSALLYITWVQVYISIFSELTRLFHILKSNFSYQPWKYEAFPLLRNSNVRLHIAKCWNNYLLFDSVLRIQAYQCLYIHDMYD